MYKMDRLSRQLSFKSILVFGFCSCCVIAFVNFSIQLLTGTVAKFDPVIQSSNFNKTANAVDDRGPDLYEKVRVLCWIMTSPNHHQTKALAVKETWGKRCNILLFMSSAYDSKLPTVQLGVKEGRNRLWGKTRESFRYAWNRYQDKVDWFLKADDDTYVVLENLRYFLTPYNTSKPLWFGHKYKSDVKSGYFSGGAGYVLSKEATRRFVKDGYYNALICRHDHQGAEDLEMGKCMENLNVSTMDTRDSKGRGRFFPFSPDLHYFPNEIPQDSWYWRNIYYPPPTKGSDCCSDSAISFHYVSARQMRILEYLIYQLRPFGIPADGRPAMPDPPPDSNLTATPWFASNNETTIDPTTNNTSSMEYDDNDGTSQTDEISQEDSKFTAETRLQLHNPVRQVASMFGLPRRLFSPAKTAKRL
ncbi:glycoprotein-N-acetylgalactosamine 3-beta-galactosyltransferase 1-like isoform X1 [Daphnia pulicaria]|uniref:glycoprotein-N-acetylgalactosamine 3-beta-galactosyltransferase 1-like isoform X1 n=1 Tax=Daphnia pulicaria TaxID=35523 RepID=UPI001EEC183A|nr:glycoprotein-N-acetylgalactosamine 3-beta-galactosyltransferase 1-like isoform X1 [Daphnia pulicaria]